MVEKRGKAFHKANPAPKEQKSGKFQARKMLLRQDLYTPEFTTWKTPGRGQAGESSN